MYSTQCVNRKAHKMNSNLMNTIPERSRPRWPFQRLSAAWLPTVTVCLWGGLLTARGQDPKLTNLQYPMDTNVSLGATVSFRVYASTTNPPMTYQWQHEGTNLPAGTNNPLVITNVTVADAGGYRAAIWNASGESTNSRTATLTVDPTFFKVTPPPGDADMYYPYWLDLNQDGWLDLVISGGFWTGGKRIMLFSNDGRGNFTRVLTNTLSSTIGRWGALLWGDYDNDGSVDVYAAYW